MTQPQISNFQFEGFTKAAQFDPLQLPDPTKLAESNIAVIRDNYNKMIQTGYEIKRSPLEKLAELAPTALEAVKEVQTYRIGQMRAEVEEEFYKNENQQFEAIAEYDQGRQVANSVESQLSEVGVRISGEGANIAHQEFLQSASGHKYTMYMEKYLQSLGQQYGNFIEDQRANSEEEITLPNGSVIKVNQAFLSPQQDRVLVQHLRSQFFQDKGVQDAPFGAKAKHLYPAMKKYEAKRDKEVTKQYGIDVSPSLRNDALSDLVDTGDMQTYLNRVSVTVDEKGKKLGFPGAQSALKDAVTNFAKNHDIAGDEILDAVLESPRFGNAFKSELAVAHRQARNTAFNDSYTAQKNEVKSLASQIVAAAQASRAAGKPMSAADIKQAVTMLQSMKPIGLSDLEAGIQAVIELEDTETISAVNLQGLREDALALAEIRRLTPDHKYFETTEGRNNEALFNKAKDFEKELLGGDFDRRNDILGDKVERLFGFTAQIGEDEAAGDIVEVVARAQEMYKESYLENLKTMSQDQASAKALTDTYDSIVKAQTDETSEFYTPDDLNFPKLYGTPSQQEAQNNAMNAVRDKLLLAGQQGNLFGSIKEDPTIITEGRDLQEDLDTYNYTGQIPAYYRDLAKRVNDKVGREYVKSGAQLLMLAAVGAGLQPEFQQESLLIRNLRNTTSQGRSMLERIFRGEKVNAQQYLLPDSVEARQAVTRPKFRKTVQYSQGNPYEQAAIYTVRFHEGTAGAAGGDKLFGDTGPGRYGTLTNKTVAEVHDIQMQALQDPQARFTDLRGNTDRSAAVGAGQFVEMIEAAQRMGVDVNKQLFDLPFQHKMMVFYAKEAGIDFTKKLTREEWNTVGSIWASISQKLGQSTNTADQTYQFYLDDLSRRGID
jgi:hypothetical protein